MTVNSFRMNIFNFIFPIQKKAHHIGELLYPILFIIKSAGFADRSVKQLGMVADILYELQASRKVEAVADALVQSRADIAQLAHLPRAVGHDAFFFSDGADGDHHRVGAVVVEMMVYGRAFDGAEVREKDGGEVRVAVGEESRGLAPEVEDSRCLTYQHDERSGQSRYLINHIIHAGCIVAAAANLIDLIYCKVIHW